MNYLLSSDPVGNFSSGTQDAIGVIICDTVSDLPAVNAFSGISLYMGSVADIIQAGDRYKLNSSGTWIKQPAPTTTKIDLSDYYTDTETDAAIIAALASYTDTAGMTAAIAAANYFLRGSQITATSDSHYDVEKMAPANDSADIRVGSWFFGASVVQYMDHMPPSFPATGGGNIRIVENQGTNRFIMEITANSVAGSGIIWRRWYTTSGWGSWYKFEGVVDS